MDLSSAFSLLNELKKYYGIWEKKTILQSVELSLMSERERLLPCSYYEFTNPVGLVVRVTLH
jgi:hypothetical protein